MVSVLLLVVTGCAADAVGSDEDKFFANWDAAYTIVEAAAESGWFYVLPGGPTLLSPSETTVRVDLDTLDGYRSIHRTWGHGYPAMPIEIDERGRLDLDSVPATQNPRNHRSTRVYVFRADGDWNPTGKIVEGAYPTYDYSTPGTLAHISLDPGHYLVVVSDSDRRTSYQVDLTLRFTPEDRACQHDPCAADEVCSADPNFADGALVCRVVPTRCRDSETSCQSRLPAQDGV